MPRVTNDVNLKSPLARKRLKPKREPYWDRLKTGPEAEALGYPTLGWEPLTHKWVLRRYKGNGLNSRIILGLADDGAAEVNGSTVLDYEMAKAAALKIIDAPAVAAGTYTVDNAMDDYIARKAARGQPVNDLIRRSRVWISPTLGHYAVRELTSERLNDWFSFIGSAPAMKRTKKGAPPQFKPAPTTPDQIRARQASANRVLNYLKGALNRAFATEKVASDAAWRGKRLEPFTGVDVARGRFLSVDEATRLIAACDPRLKPLVQAALYTGARLGELLRLQVQDFNPKGTVYIQRTKTYKNGHIRLTDEGRAFFAEHCAGRSGLMFPNWGPSAQGRPMREACERAGIDPPICFRDLRRTWGSLSAEAGMSLQIIGGVLGHSPGSPITAKHYAHLSESHVADEIRAKAPTFSNVYRKSL